MMELINPYVVKILTTAKDKDSIREISKKINESYGWTHNWVLKLERIGAIRRKKQEICINKENAFYRQMIELIKNLLASNLSLGDAYLLPNLSGLEYMFTDTDAVFIWTKGGYNIGRSRDSYPIFIKALEIDKKKWRVFFSDFGIKYAFKNKREKGIYFVISTANTIEKGFCQNMPVLPLSKTVEWAQKYRFNFEPALEMLDEMYDLKLDVKYKGMYA